MSGAARQGFRVFVANLPWTIGSHELRLFGSSFGPVVNSSVVFDKNTGISKGYGFLTFGTRDAFSAATKGGMGSHFLEGSYISVQPVNNNTNPNHGQNNNNQGGGIVAE